jgi:hypothetical protein
LRLTACELPPPACTHLDAELLDLCDGALYRDVVLAAAQLPHLTQQLRLGRRHRAQPGSVALGLTLVRNQSNTVVGRGSGLGAMMRAVCLAAALCVVAADIITNCIDNNTLS